MYASKPPGGAFTWFYTFGGAACLFHHVLPKIAEAFAREITLSARMIAMIAFVGLLSSVSALVFFHMRSSSA